MSGKILVIGATGTIGGEVVSQLAAAGVPVRALARNPDALAASLRAPVRDSSAASPRSAVEVVRGDLTSPDSLDPALDGVDAVFLVWTAPPAAFPAALERIAKQVPRLVFLSAPYWTPHPFFQQPNPMATAGKEMERLMQASGIQCGYVRPQMFASNAILWWAESIRAGSDVVRWPFAEAATAPTHEHDIAAVSIRLLCDEGHHGQDYVVTGPESLTLRQQVEIIGGVLGRPLRFEEISREEARAELVKAYPGFVVDMLHNAFAAALDGPAWVTSTVEEVTGRPARTFREWVIDHAEKFRRA